MGITAGREEEREEEMCTEQVAGRARVETRRKDAGRRVREEERGIERAILSPFECFLFEKWNFMRNGARRGSGRLIRSV